MKQIRLDFGAPQMSEDNLPWRHSHRRRRFVIGPGNGKATIGRKGYTIDAPLVCPLKNAQTLPSGHVPKPEETVGTARRERRRRQARHAMDWTEPVCPSKVRG